MGAMQRPAHLEARQQTGAAFSEDAVLINVNGRRSTDGRWITDPNPTETTFTCSTEEAEAEERDVSEGVSKKIARRTFFTAVGLDPRTTGMGGDHVQASRILWSGEFWRVDVIGRWRWGFDWNVR